MTGFAAALYENLPFPVLIVDGEARVVSHNEAAARVFGWSRADRKPSGSPIVDAEAPAVLLARHASEGRENAYPFSFRHDNGSLFEASSHVISLPDEPDGARYALLLRSLLSGGSHGEQILLGQRIAAALDTMTEGFAIFDSAERLVMFNRSYKERCGEARDAVRVGATLESIVRANIRVGMLTGICEGTPEAEEVVRQRLETHRNPDSGGTIFEFGKDRWIRGESHVAETGDIVALRVDISELKRTEVALEEKRRDYLSLLEILPDMILRFDRNLCIQYANNNYAERFGKTPGEMIGTSVADTVTSQSQQSLIDEIQNFSLETPIIVREICATSLSGEPMWVQWTAIAIFDGDVPVEFVAVGRNVTSAKLQQAQVEDQTNELRRKNEALDQFTATVSHDLKAPLRHLSMFAEMISEDVHRGEHAELPHYADHVRKSAARMRRIIDSLLEFSQIAYRITKPKPVDLSDVVRDALALFETHVQEAGGSVDVAVLPEIMGDHELLKRLAQNLIGNALKYCRPGEAPVVRVYCRESEEAVDLIIEDDGIGIDPQHVGRIFEVFQRLHRDETVYQGTGVGLALARRIVESHNGVIALDTSYGPGARFIVTFPQPMKPRGNDRDGLAQKADRSR